MPDETYLDVLVVNQYLPPDTSATADVFRAAAMALAESGHRITVLAGRPSYEPTARLSWRLLRRTRVDGVTVERVGSSEAGRGDVRSRVWTYITYLVLAGLRVLLRRRPDVVLVGSDPPIAVWVGLLAARGRPVVYWLQDLHPDVAVASGMIGDGWAARLWDRIHVAALRRCDRVVCLSEAMAARVRGKGVPAQRIEVVPNGAPAPSGPAEPDVVAELRGGRGFVAVYAGNLGEACAWETLAEAALALERDGGDRALAIVGDGPHADDVRALGVTVRPYLPAEQVPSVMAAGDLQVVALRPGMDGLVLPSKLYTILAHGRPVLAVAPPDGELAAFVREHGCGVVADPQDPDAVVRAITTLADDPQRLEAMARAAEHVGQQLRRSDTQARVVALTTELVSR